MPSASFASMVKDIGNGLGLSISPHRLRHTSALSFLGNGSNPFELQIALGHSLLVITRHYTQALGYEDVIRRHKTASPVEGL